jgi:hypothetical protein
MPRDVPCTTGRSSQLRSRPPGRRPVTRAGCHDTYLYARFLTRAVPSASLVGIVASVTAQRIDAGLRAALAG